MNEEAALQVSKSDGVAVMRLNRPRALNALNPSLLESLIAAVDRARRDQEVRLRHASPGTAEPSVRAAISRRCSP